VSWLRKIANKLSGAEAREQEEAARLAKAQAWEILAEHEAREHFGAEEALARITAIVGEARALELFAQYCAERLKPIVEAALADNLLTPEEELRIDRARHRYGGIQLDAQTEVLMSSARSQHEAWATPLLPIETMLMLKRGEWCVHSVPASAHEERQKTTRVNYQGATASVRIVKGVYYRAGSIQAERVTEAYMHSFGDGILAATNQRIMWISPQKSISIPLAKIVQYVPYVDGIKLVKDTGKPLLFVFPQNDPASMVRIGRTIEELRP
jgi:hypothetical protein